MENTNKPQWLIDAEQAMQEFNDSKYAQMSSHSIIKSMNWMNNCKTFDYSEINRKRNLTLGKEGRLAARNKQIKTLGKKGLSEVARKINETLGPEGRSLRSKKGVETMGSEGCSQRSKKRAKTLGKDKLSEISKKGRVKIPVEKKKHIASQGGKQAAQNKAARALELYQEVLNQLPETFIGREAFDILKSMGYDYHRWIMMSKCKLIERLPHTGKVNQYNPYVYKKILPGQK